MKIFPFRNDIGRNRPKPGEKKKAKPGNHRFRAWLRLYGRTIRRLAIAASAVFLILLLYIPTRSVKGIGLTEGQIAKENIIAPFDFPVMKDQEALEQEQEIEARKILPVVRVSEEQTEALKGAVRDFFYDVESILDTEEEVTEQHRMISELDVPFTETARNVLLDLASETRLRQEVSVFFDEILNSGVLSDAEYFSESGYDRLSVVRDGEEFALALDQFYDLEEIHLIATERGRQVFDENHALLTTFYEVVNHFVAPNMTYDVTATATRRDTRRMSVSPFTELYLKDQKIVGAHERVTKKDMLVLRSLEAKLVEEQIATSPWRRLYPVVGRFLVVVTVITLFATFLRKSRPKIYERDMHLILLAVIGVLGIGFSATLDAFDLSMYLLPIALVGMLASLLFDERVGMGVVGAYLVVIGLLGGLPLPLLFTLSVTGSTAAYGVAGIRNRGSFWKSLSYLAAAYIVSIAAADFLHLTPSMDTLRKIGFGLLSAFASAGITMITLPLFENIFKVTTNITLLELSDLNRPLLKNLSLFAPGTYHHSIMVGNLAEAACEQIGANSLLGRVGGYYHDIGKMSKPEYFVENQIGGENKHDKLSPKLSALILVSHVREGVEMARRARLPKEIIDAIKEHHGTACMAFFYDKAQRSAPGYEVPEGDFRYPGPKPRTRVNGVMMLADVSEAAVRALDEPTPTRIRTRILKVTNAKFEQGQLDDCDLTFRELRLIQESFVPILTSSMHSRIRYPDELKREERQIAVGDLFRKSPRKL